MEIPQNIVEKWQNIWQNICNMAYFRKNVVNEYFIVDDHAEYLDLVYYSSNASNFELITFDYTWKQIDSIRNPDGSMREPLVVPELEKVYIPYILFNGLGTYTFFNYSFPNCKIVFWEDKK